MDPDVEWMQPITAEEIVQSREEHDRFVAELLTAAKNGDATHVTDILDDEVAIECGINANSYDNDDTTPLQVAAASGHTPVIELLLSRGADPLLCNQFGWTPLMHAAYHGHGEVVECLIKAGVNVNSRSFLENCPLKLAAREGHAKVVTILLDHGCLLETYSCSAFSMSCDYNLTPLMVAAVNKQDEIVRIMLERGADMNSAMRPTGMTVLMLSVLFGELTTVQLLLNHGADPETTNVLGQTAYDLAVAANKRDFVALLEPCTKNKPDASTGALATSGIIEAIYEGNMTTVEEILKGDSALADFVSPDDASTPLIIASMLGRLDIVTLLVSQGASLNRQDKKAGWTALMQATYHAKPNVAKYLIHQGADVNLKSYDGYTAFDLAAMVQSSDDGGLLSLLAYRIAEQNVTKAHKSRHFLAFLFRHNRNNGMDSRKLTSPSKPMNWWRKFKSRFRRSVTTVRRSASVANFHSTMRTRSSLSGHEMTAVGEGSKSLKNSLFYSCDDLLRVQTLRRSSLDSSIIHRATATPNQQQASKLGAATIAPRHPSAITNTGCSLSPIPPFCAPPFLTVDTSKMKVPTVIINATDAGKVSRPPSSLTTASTIAGSTTSTINFARFPATTIAKNPASSNGSSDQEKGQSSSSGSPPKSDCSFIGKASSDYSSSGGEERSLASMNAARLGTGKTTPQRVPLPKKASTALAQVPLPKKASSACDLSLPLRRTTTPIHPPSVSTSSSGSTAANANMLGPNYRMKRPQALYITSNNGGGAPVSGGRKQRANRVLRRPHSYHDAAMESGVMYGVPYQGVGRKPKMNAPPPLNIGRPCSYQDPAVTNSSQTLNDLPITPTRKSFNLFASDLPSSFQSKCSSSPHLAASLSNSSGRSSVITPIRRPTQYAVSPTNYVSHGPIFFPNTGDGKDHLQHTLWKLGLQKYANVFREQEVDMETFLTLTDSDLKDLGIMDPANRTEILMVVRTLNFCIQGQRRYMNEVREVHNEREDESVG